ncbi:hypothetical protein CC1G_15013 [Coprinopsis cinerea okayama7|uniref:Uncharacterized protein n=1 Tax=Coprinopsis cinerea (strain Okayama-7 / 130 / ATCC MYA-4618 / FGSC 9003) TaxID=240176 RepID=D6RP65_COPC7|nr:hypothetical protein CC1G_15013 [Coprinopsis cinerea okayama7\|eukprot:XP_002910682.1 hypothetical protein CC1G_15013 [Coprinopsis cinerea okayama7\
MQMTRKSASVPLRAQEPTIPRHIPTSWRYLRLVNQNLATCIIPGKRNLK